MKREIILKIYKRNRDKLRTFNMFNRKPKRRAKIGRDYYWELYRVDKKTSRQRFTRPFNCRE